MIDNLLTATLFLVFTACMGFAIADSWGRSHLWGRVLVWVSILVLIAAFCSCTILAS